MVVSHICGRNIVSLHSIVCSSVTGPRAVG